MRRAKIAAARARVDRVIISTDSDDVWYSAIGDGPAPPGGSHRHHRPAHLAGPDSQIEDAIAQWLETADVADDDICVLLQPTSCFTRPETIVECVRLARLHGAALTVRECPEAYFAGDLNEHDGYAKVSWRHSRKTRPRSQDLRWVTESGSVYAFTVEHFRETGCRMKRRAAVVVTSWLEAFEIDDPEDLEIARALVGVADGT